MNQHLQKREETQDLQEGCMIELAEEKNIYEIYFTNTT